MNAREELYAFTTAAFKETGVPPLVHKYLTKSINAYRAEILRDAADAVAENLKDTPEYGEYVADFLRRLADADDRLDQLFKRLGPPEETDTATS